MSSTYKATCKCGATIEVPYSDNFKQWVEVHSNCLKTVEEQLEKKFSVDSYIKGFDTGYAKAFDEIKEKQTNEH